jgi:hypothetical protein
MAAARETAMETARDAARREQDATLREFVREARSGVERWEFTT